MSTRRDRAAHAIHEWIWPGADFDGLRADEAYRIADTVLAEVDRIPDVSEVEPGLVSDPLRTPEDWCRIEGVEILDPDGWRGVKGRPWTDRISLQEFRERLVVCTMLHKTDDGAVRSPATPGAVPNPAAQAGETGWRPAPSSLSTDGGAVSPPAGPHPAAERATAKAAPPSVLPRPFLLFRHRDVTGKSGTGVVAWGTEWPDKTASLRWATEYPSTVHWDSVEAILAVHGHQGATVIHWLNGGA